MIRFENVAKQYDSQEFAVQNLNFEINDGEFFVLVGPSGCGKTTTLKMINRLHNATSGEIFIEDHPITSYNIHELRWNIGYVLQQIALFPNMTIEENIAIVPELKKWSKQQINERTKELLRNVGLNPATYLHRFPSELSGGQQQRIGVLRALAADPKIILMDEPFSALDPLSRQKLQKDIKSMQKEIKKTIVFVTHDMNEALLLGDRIALMQNGQIVQIDTPTELLAHPKTAFVQEFLASGSLLTKQKQLKKEYFVTDLIQENLLTPTGESTANKTINSNESLTVLIQRIAQEKKLFVIDDRQQVLGILSQEDVLNFLALLIENERLAPSL